MALTASPEDQAALLDLQALDTKLNQLAHRAKKLPEIAKLAAIASEVERLRVARAGQLGAVEDTKIELSRIESDVELVEARIVRDMERLQGSSSVKDVAGLESELTGLRRRRDELEEIELAVMERLENDESALQLMMAEHTAALEEGAKVGADRDGAVAAIVSEQAHTSANRSTICSKLPADLVSLYERQRGRYGSGASHLRGGVSSASGVKLLENEVAAIRAAAPDDVLICPDSQAILVRTNESGL